MDRSSNEPNRMEPSGDSASVAAHVGEAMRAELPLSDALGALADSTEDAREAAQLRSAAAAIEGGATLDEALSRWGGSGLLRKLVARASRSPVRGLFLTRIIEQRQRIQSLRRRAIGDLAYPLLILIAGLIVGFGVPMLVTSEFEEMFKDFGIQQPPPTRWLIRIGNRVSPAVLVMVAGFAFLAVVARVLLRPGRLDSVMAALPLMGPIWQWTATAESLHWLGALLATEFPLPEALRLVADQTPSLDASRSCQRLADEIDQGHSLTLALQQTGAWPQSIVPVISWGERSGAITEAFDAGAEFLEKRAEARAEWVRATVPPFVMLLVATMVTMTFIGALMPLVQFVSKLI
jgi:type II secretory pathway component PulF